MSSTTNPKPQTRDFFELVKAIGESKSKQEEDRIVADEVQFLKKAVPQPGLNKRKMKELVIRMLYVEMLGNDASFAYIKAVELCASTSVAQKRTGYLAASLCLSPDHEFRFMLVNMIQRDMKSTNQLEICAALAAVNKIVTEDMIPAIIGDVLALLKHEQVLVRKKAVSALHRLYQMDRHSLVDHVPKIRATLCDKDPSVMSATLPLFHSMILDDSAKFKDLVPSLVSILKQITEHRLPREYDYHRIPAPWIQMNLLKVLALLGRGDQSASEGMYEVLVDVMKRADTGINIGYAIVYEVVNTITKIYPNTLLLEAAATSISRFIRSESHNLKYIGIKGLASIVKDYPKYAADHQMAVIDCLEDPDETLKRKTLDLLYRMTNGVNVEFIIEKLLSFLSTSTDDYFRTDLVTQITQCAERFAPSNAWYVQTVIRVFELAGDKVKPAVAHTLTQLIAEGSENDDDDEDDDGSSGDDELRTEAVENFLDLMERPKLPETLAQAIAWVMGEYGYLSTSCSKEQIMNKLAEMSEASPDASTKAQIITAIIKLVAQNGSCPSEIMSLADRYSSSMSLELQQRCREFKQLLQHSETMVDVLPVDASCEDIEVDENLSFLNSFVQQALNMGAKPYSPPQTYDDDGDNAQSGKAAGLKMTPYEMPKIPTASANANALSSISNVAASSATSEFGPTPLGPALANPQPVNLNIANSQGNNLINTRGVNQVWGKKPEPPPPAPASVAAPVETVVPPQPLEPTVDTLSVANATSSVTESTTTASSVASPAAPRELTEKEKMAAALFGGVGKPSGGSGGKASGSSRRRSAERSIIKETNNSPADVSAANSVTPVTDLMGLSSAVANDIQMTPAVAPQVAPQTQSAPAVSGSSDLLDMDLLGESTSTLPPAATLTSTQTPSVPVANSAAEPTNLSVSDAFSDMSLLSTASNHLPNNGVHSEITPLQPLQISTAEFGKRWGSTRFESKTSVQCTPMTGPKTLEQLRAAMPQSYYHVESITATQEAIFAAVITASAVSGGFLLVHCKLNAGRGTCDLLVKSNADGIVGVQKEAIATTLTAFRGS